VRSTITIVLLTLGGIKPCNIEILRGAGNATSLAQPIE